MPGMLNGMASRGHWLLVGALCLSACLWSSYEEILRVHVEVLAGMVDKVEAKAQAGRRPTPNDVTELLYPLERARQFLHQYEKRKDRESYRSFQSLLDRYQRLVTGVDVARIRDDDWARFRPRLSEQSAEWRAAATFVLDAITREERKRT